MKKPIQIQVNKIFDLYFTTKKDGHGFGLHSGVLAAEEMNGSLTVHSRGLGVEQPLRLNCRFSRQEKSSHK